MSNKKQDLIQQVENAQRQLLTRWSISPEDINNMPIHISENLSDILKEEIEAEQSIELLKSVGWYSIKTPDNEIWSVNTLTEWCKSNCNRKYKVFYHTCLFEDKEDATKFNLVWG